MTDKIGGSSTLPFGIATLKVHSFQFGTDGTWVLVESHLPRRTPQAIGIILLDGSRDEMHLRLKPNWWADCPDEECDTEIWGELANDLEQLARNMGAKQMLHWLSSGSHALRVGEPRFIQIQDPETTLDLLYNKYICETCKEISHIIAAPQSRVLAWKRWLSAAASATVVLGLFRHYGRFDAVHRKQQSPRALETSTLRFVDRGITLDGLSSVIQLPLTGRMGHHPRIAGTDSRTRRKLRIAPPTAEPHIAEIVQLPDPPSSVPTVTLSSMRFLPEQPAPPRFRRRNRILRILKVVAIPLRLLASR
jgi:hypothetical protein